MEDNALTYKRATLISVLQDRLAEAERKRAEAKAKADERNKKVRDQIVELIDTHPSFLINLVGGLEDKWGSRPGTEAFKLAIDGAYVPADRWVADDDDRLKRLIRVYEKAENETVEVTVHDEVFAYL